MAVTQIKVLKLGAKPPIIEFEGESTDTKPTYGGANSKFTENDTGKKFYFNGTEWKALAASEGGSGGGSDGGSASVEQFLITFSVEEDQQNEGEFIVTTDKTYAQVSAAYDAGALLVASVEQDGDEIARLGLSGAYYTGSGYDFVFESVVYRYEFRVGIGEDGAYYEDTAGSDQPSGGEPFVVTLELDAQTGSLVGDKTYVEVQEAYIGGQRVIVSAEVENMFGLCADIISVDYTSEGLAFALILNGEIQHIMCEAANASNYFTISMGG